MGQMEFRDGISGGVTPHGDPKDHVYVARVLTYNKVDSHGTSWAPGVFSEHLRTGLPVSVWSHDSRRPIGKVVEYRDTEEALDVFVKYANLDAVPDARMAHSLQEDGIIDQYSFAFTRLKDEPCPNGGERRITKAKIHEVSPVLVASGQGTGTLGVRSDQTLNRAEADDLLRRVALGELDARSALEQLSNKREAPMPEVRWSGMTGFGVTEETRAAFIGIYPDYEELKEGDTVIGLRAKSLSKAPSEEAPAETAPDADVEAELRSLDELEAEEY